jgi:DNA-directed RNA polymerase omega subunit
MYKLPEDLESKYAFVSLASARAEQLQQGAVPKVEDAGQRKFTVIAQQEVAEKHVEQIDQEELERLEAEARAEVRTEE